MIDFLAIWAVCYAINLALYFGMGWGLMRLNRDHPELKIQPGRDGMKRARAEILESVASIAVTTFCLALALLITWNGWGLWALSDWGILNTIIGAVLLIVGYDTWYYWAHRLLHTGPFYRFHQWHHKSVAPTVWSADSQSVVETALIQGFMIAAALVLPITPVALILHRLYDHVNGQIGHCGYEYAGGPATSFPSPMVAVAYHDVHHSRFKYNFGNYFSVWDRLMGTMDPGYDAKNREASVGTKSNEAHQG